MNNFEAVTTSKNKKTLNIKKWEWSEVEDWEDDEHSDEIKIDNIGLIVKSVWLRWLNFPI